MAQPAITGSRTFTGAPAAGGGVASSVDLLGALSGSGVSTASVYVLSGETIIVIGTIDAALVAASDTVAIFVDGTTGGSVGPWHVGASADTVTVQEAFAGLSAGYHDLGLTVNGTAVSDGLWSFTVLHYPAASAFIHVATGG